MTRYVCPCCSRGSAKRAAAVAHLGRCWLNPENRACKTCRHFIPADFADWDENPAYVDPERCARGVNLTDTDVYSSHPSEDRTPTVVRSGCELWEVAER